MFGVSRLGTPVGAVQVEVTVTLCSAEATELPKAFSATTRTK